MKPILNALLLATAVIALSGNVMAQDVGVQTGTDTGVTGTTTTGPDTTGSVGAETTTGIESELDSGQVEMLEQTLENRGYSIGSADGVMDSETEAALREFQEDNGLMVTGTATTETMTELGMNSTMGLDTEPGFRAPDVGTSGTMGTTPGTSDTGTGGTTGLDSDTGTGGSMGGTTGSSQ